MKNESFDSGKIIESKEVTFHQPTISNSKQISFHVKNKDRFFVHIDINYGTWQVGTKIDLVFESGEKVTTYITLRETERTGSTQTKRYDCQITDRKTLDKIYLHTISKITVHCIGQTFDLPSNKSKKVKAYFNCVVNTIGADKINFEPAEKSAPDPYTDNTIIVGFGNTDNTDLQPDVKCEYEKNQVDEFTGDKTVVTKTAILGDKLTGYLEVLGGSTFLNLNYDGLLGCVNVESFIIIKFMDASTLNLMNLAKEDCGENPTLKVDLTSNIAKLKIRDIEKIRISMSDGQADITIKQPDYIRGVLIKCL